MPDPKKTIKKEQPKEGYTKDTVSDVKNYLQKYYQSDFFKKNLEKGQSGWKIGKAGKVEGGKMSEAVKNTIVKIINNGESLNEGNVANISTTQLPNENAGLVTAHELAHSNENAVMNAQPRNAYLMLSQNKGYNALDTWVRQGKAARINAERNQLYQAGQETLNTYSKPYNEYEYGKYMKGVNPVSEKIQSINQYFSKTNPDVYHDDSPNEIRADVLGLRYLAQKNKIWDPVANPGEKLDKEKFNKIMNMKELNNKGESEIKKRLKLRFNDDALKYFLENVAVNSKNPGLYNQNNV